MRAAEWAGGRPGRWTASVKPQQKGPTDFMSSGQKNRRTKKNQKKNKSGEGKRVMTKSRKMWWCESSDSAGNFHQRICEAEEEGGTCIKDNNPESFTQSSDTPGGKFFWSLTECQLLFSCDILDRDKVAGWYHGEINQNWNKIRTVIDLYKLSKFV